MECVIHTGKLITMVVFLMQLLPLTAYDGSQLWNSNPSVTFPNVLFTDQEFNTTHSVCSLLRLNHQLVIKVTSKIEKIVSC